MSRIRIGIVGMGKIARDQHLPAIAASDAFELAAVASPHHRLEGVRHYADVAALLDAEPDIAALAVCTPPQIRYAIARQAIERGRHVLLEKPPAATLSEAAALAELAARAAPCGASWSPGKRTSASGIPDRNGSGAAGGWACSTLASTPCPS